MKRLRLDRLAFAAALLLGGLLYVLSPVDAIPDFLPVIGWLDDLMALVSVGIGAGALAFSALALEQRGREPDVIDYEPIPPEIARRW